MYETMPISIHFRLLESADDVFNHEHKDVATIDEALANLDTYLGEVYHHKLEEARPGQRVYYNNTTPGLQVVIDAPGDPIINGCAYTIVRGDQVLSEMEMDIPIDEVLQLPEFRMALMKCEYKYEVTKKTDIQENIDAMYNKAMCFYSSYLLDKER